MYSLSSAAVKPHLVPPAGLQRRNTWGVRMQNRNYFNALAGLKLEDSPSSSPTAAAAASRYGLPCLPTMTKWRPALQAAAPLVLQ